MRFDICCGDRELDQGSDLSLPTRDQVIEFFKRKRRSRLDKDASCALEFFDSVAGMGQYARHLSSPRERFRRDLLAKRPAHKSLQTNSRQLVDYRADSIATHIILVELN